MQHYSKADHCYLDFDFRRPWRRSPRLRPIWTVLRMVGVRPLLLVLERTLHGWHGIIKLNQRLQPAELVALEACMGSDRKRAALNLMRAIAIRKGNGVTAYWKRRSNILYSGKL